MDFPIFQGSVEKLYYYLYTRASSVESNITGFRRISFYTREFMTFFHKIRFDNTKLFFFILFL